MKETKIRANIDYFDAKIKKSIRKGTIYEVSEERGHYLTTKKVDGKFAAEIISTGDFDGKKGKRILIYQEFLYKIGGIETFLHNFLKFYKDKNILLCFREGDKKCIEYLGQYAEVVRDYGQEFDCDVCILASTSSSAIINRVKAKKIYQMIHGDMAAMSKLMYIHYSKHPKVNKVISVSEQARKGLKSKFAVDSKVIYNILDVDVDTRKPLKLITLSRGTVEKGIHRIAALAKKLKEFDRPFVWFLCGTMDEQANTKVLAELRDMPEVIFMPPSPENKRLIPVCDYLVQLSDTESFCYSAYEALQQGVPCILTDYPEAHTTIKDGKSGYIISQNVKDYNKRLINKICDKIPTEVTYEDKCDYQAWEKILSGK